MQEFNVTRRTLLKTAMSTATIGAGAATGLFPMPAVAAKSKVVYWSPNDITSDALQGRAEAAMIEVVKAKLPDIEIEVQAMPWQYMGQQTIQAVMSGGGPDVVQLSTTELADQVGAQTAQPLDDYVGKGWSEAERADFVLPWEMTVYDGAKMSFLWNTVLNNHLFYVKSRIESEPPQQAEAFAQRLSGLGVGGDEIGFATSFSQDGNAVVFVNWLIPLLWSAGVEFLTENGEIGFGNAQGHRAFEWIVAMVNKHKLTPPAAVSATRQNIIDAMSARKAMTTVLASNAVQSVRAGIGDDLGLAMQPGIDGVCPAFAVGKPLIMTRTAADPVAAGLFIEALVSPEAQLARTKISKEIPARKSVLADEWFKSPEAADIGIATAYMEAHPKLFRFREGASKLQIGLALAVQQMISGRPITEAIDQVASEWRA